MAQRRPDPRRSKTLAHALQRLPAPPKAHVTYGPLSDAELGGQMTAGLTYPDTGEIRLAQRDRFGLAHELFHALDTQVFTDSDRARFQTILQAPSGPWRAGTGVKGKRSPSEIAADYYAAIATGLDPRHEGSGAYVDAFGPKRMRRFENSLGRLMRRRGLSALDLGSY
jgi:hypothetical protein